MTTLGSNEQPCTVDSCNQPAHERRICHTCAGQLTRDLATMPALLDDLAITLSRQARIGEHTNGSASRERPLPYDPRASEAGDILKSTLIGWVRELHDGVEHYPTDTLHAMALWLHMRNPRLLNHPQAHEAVDEIGAAVKHTHHVIDRPMPRVYAGRCHVDDCDGELYAKPTTPDVACPTCGITHSVAERRQTMRDTIDEMLFTLPEIARMANYFDGFDSRRASKLLNIWETRGRIHPTQTLPDGQTLYPFGVTLTRLLNKPNHSRTTT